MTTQSSDLQRIYEQLIEFDERDRPRFRVFSSRSDRVAVLLALAFFCLGGIAALLAWSHGIEKADLVNKILRWVALSFLLLAELTALVNVIVGVLPMGKLVKDIITDPVRTLLTISVTKTERDYAFAATLSENDESVLKFAAERLRSEAEHCRARFGMFFGAIDRTGLFPLAVTIGLTVWKFLHDAAIPFSILYPAVAVVIPTYFVGLAGFSMTHRLEELAEIMDLSPFLAQKVKAQNSSNGEFESWGYHAGSSRKSSRLPRCGS